MVFAIAEGYDCHNDTHRSRKGELCKEWSGDASKRKKEEEDDDGTGHFLDEGGRPLFNR